MKYEKINGTTHIYVGNDETELDVARAILKASFATARSLAEGVIIEPNYTTPGIVLGTILYDKNDSISNKDVDSLIQFGVSLLPFKKANNVQRFGLDSYQGRRCKTDIEKVNKKHFTPDNYIFERDRGAPDKMLDMANEILAKEKITKRHK
ncbi:MAG: hypothetical protein Q8N37_04780 [bacterium]|nr:hypothetical protein [bacterium]